MYIPGEPAPVRQRRIPLHLYLKDLPRHPARTLSDIALDRPWLRGLSLLLAAFAVAGAGLGITGLPGTEGGLPGAALGLVTVPAVSGVAFLAVSLVYHGMAKALEGEGSFVELVSALSFAFLPLGLLAPASLLRLLPGALGGLAFFLACMAIAGWTIRLTYLGVREAHRFVGTQAILTMTVPLTMIFLVSFLILFVTAMAILVVG